MRTLVFVYGTLKRGGRNDVLLRGQEFVQAARTLPRYRLYDSGSYPCLVEEPSHGLAVQGEVWRVDADALARLDELEEVPSLFTRREVALAVPLRPVLAYFYQRDVSGLKDCGDTWPAEG
jgi:gamma-glutamylaminecyclotransferase